MRFRGARSLLTLLIVPAFAGGFLLRDLAPQDGARLFSQVVARVTHEALDSLGTSAIYERAARGLVSQLDDPYADLYSPEELAAFSRQTLGNDYAGVGMQIEDQQGIFRVSKVFPGTPAERGGVLTGDRIVTVDGTSTEGLRLDEVSGRLLGRPGTDVAVVFERAAVEEPIRTRFTRAVVHVPAVPYTLMLAGDVGYIPLQRFNGEAGREVADAVRALRIAGARGLVLDLRGNPGGDLDQAMVVANVFLPRGQELAQVRYRSDPDEVHVAHAQPESVDEPLVVLVDESSASASEIVAGALQDHDRALVVGAPTFGKGVVQSLFPLESGWALKLTTGRWYTPSGRSIQRDAQSASDDTRYRSDAGRPLAGGGGITPDLPIERLAASPAEERLLRLMGPQSQQAYVALYEIALELRDDVAPDFAVEPAWREAYVDRLAALGIDEEETRREEVQPLLDRMIEQRVATVAFGDSAAFRRALPYDPALERALAVIGESRSQRDLFAFATMNAGTTGGGF